MTLLLIGVGWGLIAALALWWTHGMYRDRKSRGGDRAATPRGRAQRTGRLPGAAGTEIGEQQLRASRQTGAGGP